MDVIDIQTRLRSFKKKTDRALKLLEEISRLEQDREENLSQLRSRLSEVEEVCKALEPEQEFVADLSLWMEEYKQILDKSEEELKKRFGIELEKELSNIGLPLSKVSYGFRSGIFAIELKSDERKAKIWYGDKQELLGQCRPTIKEIVKNIERIKKNLGSGLSDEEFLKKLNQAYERLEKGREGEKLPIIEVLSEVAYLMQDTKFKQDPRRENYKSYSRADFSYDLYRIRKYTQSRTLHLVVATRAHTNSRHKFLWIPDDESGKGTTYSHLQFKRGSL